MFSAVVTYDLLLHIDIYAHFLIINVEKSFVKGISQLIKKDPALCSSQGRDLLKPIRNRSRLRV